MLEEAHTVAVFQSLSPSCPTLLSWSHTVLIIQLLSSNSSAKAAPELQPGVLAGVRKLFQNQHHVCPFEGLLSHLRDPDG